MKPRITAEELHSAWFSYLTMGKNGNQLVDKIGNTRKAADMVKSALKVKLTSGRFTWLCRPTISGSVTLKRLVNWSARADR
jgi:hypothetical protein